MTSSEATPESSSAAHVPAEELVRRQGVRPIMSVAGMAQPDLFESDEELDEFIAEVYAARRAGMA